MKRKSLFWGIAAGMIVTGLLSGCKKDKDEKPDYDRKTLLENIGNNIVLPNYKTLQSTVRRLDSTVTDFNASPDGPKLDNLQGQFREAYKAWQLCSVFELGPAADMEFLRKSLNTFPTDTNQIRTNIASGTYSLESAENADAIGFPAIDYLLFGKSQDDAALLAGYTTDSKAENRKQYLAALSAEIKGKVDNVVNAWLPSGGNYLNTFVNAAGTDIGSSVGLLVNQLNYDAELLKNAKFGIPSGIQINGTPFPYEAEACYSGNSAELALIQLKNLENVFLGRSDQGDGQGFDDYLDQLQAPYNGGSLSTAIKNQFTKAIARLEAVQDPLTETVTSNPASVEAAYMELQKLVVLLKTDLPSALGVLITYADNDGD